MADLNGEFRRVIARRGGSKFDEPNLSFSQRLILVKSHLRLEGCSRSDRDAVTRTLRHTRTPHSTATNRGVNINFPLPSYIIVLHHHSYSPQAGKSVSKTKP
jgi:hypothetical protein